MNPKLLILLICVASFSIIEASAQESSSETYNLRVRSEPNILFLDGGGDYKAGTEVSIDAAPLTFKDYKFVGWQIDGRWADGNPISVRMDNSHSAIAIYSKDVVGSIIVDAIPRIAEITVDGTIYLPDEFPLSFNWAEGSTHIISIPTTIKESSGKRYVFDSWKDKNTESDRTITVGPGSDEFIALLKTQHFLKPISQYGTVTGGGWQDAGKSATFELESDIIIDKKDPNIRYVFESWDSGDYQTLPTNNIDIEDEAATVKAIWDTQYFVKLTTDIPDYELFGSGWYTQDRKLALIAEESLESPNSDTNYVFEKWVSKGPNPVVIPDATSPVTQIIVSEPYVIEAQYKQSYLVNVWTPYGTATGSGFYEEGSTAEITISTKEVVTEPNQVKMVFDGWETNGAKTMDFNSVGISADTVQNLLITVEKPETITSKWKTQYYLDVQSTEGKTKGSGWYDIGRLVPISVDTLSTPPGMWSVSAFDRWTGDIESTSINQRVMMSGPKTIIAEFKQDSMPGVLNSIIIAAIGGVGFLVYTKTQKPKFNFKRPKHDFTEKQLNPFEKFRDNPFESDLQISRGRTKKKAVMDWLMGR